MNYFENNHSLSVLNRHDHTLFVKLIHLKIKLQNIRVHLRSTLKNALFKKTKESIF